MRRSFFIILATVLSLSLFAGYYAFKVAGGALASAAVMVAFILMMVPYLALGFDRVVDGLRAVGRNHRARLLLMGLALMLPGIVVLIGGKGTFSALNLAILAAYVSVPILILSSGRRPGSPPTVTDLVVVLLLWLPVELQYFETFWTVPAGNPSYVLAKTLGMELALYCFVVVRRLEGVGYRFRLAPEDLTVGMTALAVFLAFAVPTALATGFVVFDPHWAGPGKWLLSSLGIFFFIALPEEVLFRGIIFNLLQRMIRKGGPYTALVLSSLIFGVAHLNNPPGDWRYVLLATAAGLCYGWAYLRTGSLMASSLTHALVDIIGRGMFPHEAR